MVTNKPAISTAGRARGNPTRQRSVIGAWVQINPDEAKARILKAARESRACIRDMAKILEVSECSLHRIVNRLELRDAVRRAGAGIE